MYGFAIRFIHRVRDAILEGRAGKRVNDKTMVTALSQLLVAIIIITATLIALPMFGIQVTALLAFGGIGGAGIAFASKDLLANFFWWLNGIYGQNRLKWAIGYVHLIAILKER